MIIKKYPDGSSYATVEDEGTSLTFKVNTYEDLWHLNQVVDAYNNLGITPTIIIPNLIDAQADRRFGSNQSSGLKLVCKFLNSMKANFRIFHPHNSEVVEALLDNVEFIDNFGFIGRVLSEEFNKGQGFYGFPQEDLVLLSSDAGGFKPLMKLSDKLNWRGEVYSASKSREYKDGKSKIIQIVDKVDFGGKDILIVDDICVNGGTFIGLAKILKEKNVGKLYLAVSHLTAPNPNPELFQVFDKVFTTDSKDIHIEVPNLKIINLF